MKVLFLTIGPRLVASSRTRVFDYLTFLSKHNVRCKVINHKTALLYHLHRFRPKGLLGRFLKRLSVKVAKKCDLIVSVVKTAWFLSLANFYDLIFIQKVLLPTFTVRYFKRCGKKVVFDFDDALYAHSRTYDKKRFDAQIPLYDLIVLENAYTKAYVNEHGNENVLSITGPIDCERYHPGYGSQKQNVVVGWIGSPHTEKYLKILQSVCRELSATHKKLVFELVGAEKTGNVSSNFILKQWSWNTEVTDLQNFDIGIMPLPDNEWTRGKGGYKLLQYMAVGIPFVASPVGINKELTQDGLTGFLASTEEEWYEKLLLLIESSDLRKTMGIRGRQFVLEKYALEASAPKLLSAFERLLGESVAVDSCYHLKRSVK